jgi:hypothetical protein
MIERDIPSENEGNNVKPNAVKIIGRQRKACSSDVIVNNWRVNYPKRASRSHRLVNPPVKSNLVRNKPVVVVSIP